MAPKPKGNTLPVPAGAEVPAISEERADALLDTRPAANPWDITVFTDEGGFWTSLKITERSERVRAMRALTIGGENLVDHLNQQIEIASVLIHGVDMPIRDAAGQTTGEFTTQPRTVLFAPDGTMYQCVSAGVVKSLRFLSALAGPPPWHPPLRVIPKQINTGSGRRYFVLDLPSEAGV